MSSFDLPPLGAFEMPPAGRLPFGKLAPPDPSLQDPERLGTPSIQGKHAIEGQEGHSRAPRFDGMLADSLAKVQSLQDDVREKTRALALGEDVELHDVMIAAGKSEVAFNLMLEVRNKLVDAWEKLSRSAV
ncbi:MAG TPA: flagellar hook-basal body complex protein FliE [Planctomycetota bacterium]|nr:flagellar hook-basal body complex protein FliE [Planctomycetota bacterium]